MQYPISDYFDLIMFVIIEANNAEVTTNSKYHQMTLIALELYQIDRKSIVNESCCCQLGTGCISTSLTLLLKQRPNVIKLFQM